MMRMSLTTWAPAGIDSRLWREVAFEPNSGCWLWMGSAGKKGYGRISRNGERYQAHRYFYAAYKGPIPEGLVMDHLCRITCCVNPDHLEAVTPKVNTNRGNATLRSETHCAYGHKWIPENIYTSVHGSQDCRACRRIRTRAANKKISLASMLKQRNDAIEECALLAQRFLTEPDLLNPALWPDMPNRIAAAIRMLASTEVDLTK